MKWALFATLVGLGACDARQRPPAPPLASRDEPPPASRPPPVAVPASSAPAVDRASEVDPADQPAAYCAHVERCGCPMERCSETMAGIIASPPVHDLASCVTQLPCEAACSDAADRSSPKYVQCVAPIQAALEERGRTIESVRAMTRGVIDRYPGGTRVEHRDENGAYLGESQR